VNGFAPGGQPIIAASTTARVALAATRNAAIDRIDGALLRLVAARRRLVHLAAACKRGADVAPRDRLREEAVHQRARHLAQRLGVPCDTAEGLSRLLVEEACRQQGLATDVGQGGCATGAASIAAMPFPVPATRRLASLRIALNRGARMARAARDAHRPLA
jgi:chorismate mutase